MKVVVLGGGIVGLSTAYELAQRGVSVTVVDRQAPTADRASRGNAGMIVPSHFVPLAAPGMVGYGLRAMFNPRSPFYLRPRLNADLIRWGLLFMRSANAGHVAKSGPLLRDLNFGSRAIYEAWDEESGGAFGLEKRGLLTLCATESGFHEESETATAAQRLGIPADVLTAAESAKILGDARIQAAGGVFFPKDCHLDPARLLHWLTQRLADLGVTFRWGTEVRGWSQKSDRISAVDLGGELLEADQFTLCGGVWSSDLIATLGGRLPLMAGKGYTMTMPTPPVQLPTCAILAEARVAVTPMGSSLRVGGTMEIAGNDLSVNPLRVEGITAGFCRFFPDFSPSHFAGVPVWAGLRPVSPDGMPYLGRTRLAQNLTVGAGHAMMGLSLGPVSGRLLAQTITREATSLDLANLSPDRFHTGRR